MPKGLFVEKCVKMATELSDPVEEWDLDSLLMPVQPTINGDMSRMIFSNALYLRRKILKMPSAGLQCWAANIKETA